MSDSPPTDWLPRARDVDAAAPPPIDYHLHTSWTDGAHTAAEMHEAAVAAGLRRVLFSEHARKTSADWFPRFAAEIRALPASSCHALVGVECKVDDDEGAVDCVDEILAECDLVMASVHRFPGETGRIAGDGGLSIDEAIEKEYRLSCAVLENPVVHILGHPFGMSYRRFGGTPPERLVRDLVARAARAGVAFEINSRYHPQPRRMLEWCRDADAVVSLGSNAHACAEVAAIQRALATVGRE